MLKMYKDTFKNLNRDQAHNWPSATLNRSPHKPFLLLSVLDLISNGHEILALIKGIACATYHMFFYILKLPV